MRKLIFAINTTLEGCVDHTKQIALNKYSEGRAPADQIKQNQTGLGGTQS
jgi:hypothetical protein